MTQSLIDDAGWAPEAGLRRLEGEVQHLREQVQVLQALVEEENSAYALPPRRRHSHPVKLYVLAGGLAAVLFGASPVLPVGNPIRQAVDYTVTGLIDQMPSEIPDPPDLDLPGSAPTIVLGNPDGEHQPLRPMAALKQGLELTPIPVGSPLPPSAGSQPTTSSETPTASDSNKEEETSTEPHSSGSWRSSPTAPPPPSQVSTPTSSQPDAEAVEPAPSAAPATTPEPEPSKDAEKKPAKTSPSAEPSATPPPSPPPASSPSLLPAATTTPEPTSDSKGKGKAKGKPSPSP